MKDCSTSFLDQLPPYCWLRTTMYVTSMAYAHGMLRALLWQASSVSSQSYTLGVGGYSGWVCGHGLWPQSSRTCCELITIQADLRHLAPVQVLQLLIVETRKRRCRLQPPSSPWVCQHHAAACMGAQHLVGHLPSTQWQRPAS